MLLSTKLLIKQLFSIILNSFMNTNHCFMRFLFKFAPDLY